MHKIMAAMLGDGAGASTAVTTAAARCAIVENSDNFKLNCIYNEINFEFCE